LRTGAKDSEQLPKITVVAVIAGIGAQRVPGDLRIVMAVIVDEPGRDDAAVSVDRLLGGTAQFADLDDFSVLDRDIAAERRHPRTVDDTAVADQQIIRHRYPFSSIVRRKSNTPDGSDCTAKLAAGSSSPA
jgi:hypothetical protein